MPGKVWDSDSDVILARSEAGTPTEARPVPDMSAASSCLCSCASAALRSQSRELDRDDSSAAVQLCSSAVSRSFQSTGANGKFKASTAGTAPEWPVTAHSGGITASAASAVRDLVADAVLCLSRHASEAPEDQEDMLCLCFCASAASQSESMEADSEGAGTAAGAAAASHDKEGEQGSNGRLDCGC